MRRAGRWCPGCVWCVCPRSLAPRVFLSMPLLLPLLLGLAWPGLAARRGARCSPCPPGEGGADAGRRFPPPRRFVRPGWAGGEEEEEEEERRARLGGSTWLAHSTPGRAAAAGGGGGGGAAAAAAAWAWASLGRFLSSQMAPRLTRRPPGPRGLLQCLLPLPFLGLWSVASMEIYTPGSLEALNGTDVRLKCTFHSSSPVGQRLTVSWSFQSQTQSQREFVFYYHEEAYPSKKGHFGDRVTWDGNVFTNDASIMIWNVNPTDNGTFQCTVNNPPDVNSIAGEIQLRVVLTVNFSEIHILALSIGTACLLMIVIMSVVVVFRHRRRVERDKKVELEHHRPEKEKLQQDPEEQEKAKEMPQLGEEASGF